MNVKFVSRCARVVVDGLRLGWCTVGVVAGAVNASPQLEVQRQQLSLTFCISPFTTPTSKYVLKLSSRPELTHHPHIYPVPQHVGSGVLTQRSSEGILIRLQGKLCTILQANFGELPFHALPGPIGTSLPMFSLKRTPSQEGPQDPARS